MRWLWRCVVLVAGVGGWQLWASAAGSTFFPPPSTIVTRMHRLWFSGPAAHLFLTADATGNLLPSLGRVLAGLAIATAIGVPLGIALGRSPAVTGARVVVASNVWRQGEVGRAARSLARSRRVPTASS